MASHVNPPCTLIYSSFMLWSKAQQALDYIKHWKPNSAEGRPMLFTHDWKTILTRAVITLAPVLLVTEDSGISECSGFEETTALRVITEQIFLSCSVDNCTT